MGAPRDSRAPLQWIWSHPEDGFYQQPFGRYPKALAEYAWDVLCLQPFDRHIAGDDGDLAMARNFVQLALPKSPDLQLYIYQRWPRKDKDGRLDYARQWHRKHTGDWDSTNETKDYFQRLVDAIEREMPDLKQPVRIIPVGQVMFELDRRMRQNEVPGLRGIGQLYQDQIHLNHVGSYLVACTFYATLFRDSPVGLSTHGYDPIDPALVKVIQETVWKVVATCHESGVHTPAPPEYTTGKIDAERRNGSKIASAVPSPLWGEGTVRGTDSTAVISEPLRSEAEPATKKPPQSLTRDERYRQLVVGTWEDDYQGKRTMTLNADGTGTMIVELRGLKATLFAARLKFNMVWSVQNGRLKKRTISGEPQTRVNMILKMMGDRVDERILELTKERLLLLDQDGETRYDWRRKKP